MANKMDLDFMLGNYRGTPDPMTPKFDWGEFGNNLLGSEERAGILPVGVSAVTGLAGAYTGLKGLELAKKNYQLNKKYAAANYGAQAKSFNLQVEDAYDRKAQAAKWAGTTPEQDKSTFLKNYRVKESV